jgi:hypothetical protein
LPLQITELVSSGKRGKLSAMNVDGLFTISSLQREPHGYGQATFGCLKPLKRIFATSGVKFLYIRNLNISGSALNEGLSTDATLHPC